MRLSDAIIDRDIAAAEKAREFAEQHACRRGQAHQQLVVGHLAHMVEGYGFAQVVNWLWDIVDGLDDGV